MSGEKPVRGNKSGKPSRGASKDHSIVLERKRMEDEAKLRNIDNQLDKQITVALNEF